VFFTSALTFLYTECIDGKEQPGGEKGCTFKQFNEYLNLNLKLESEIDERIAISPTGHDDVTTGYHIDSDGNGWIDFAEFCHFLYYILAYKTDEAEKMIQGEESMVTFRLVVRDIMGDQSLYSPGRCIYTDLLIWSVILNRIDISKALWSKVRYPVETALMAKTLLFKLSRAESSDPSTCKTMQANAEIFEQYAIGVQQIAMQRNPQDLPNLERVLADWKDEITLVDLAWYGKAEDFLESCCEEALVRRNFGDLQPTFSNDDDILPTFSGFGILANVLTLGLLSSIFVSFADAPLSENDRLPTQHRNKKDESTDTEGARTQKVRSHGSDLGLSTYEALRLFWKSPYVLFLAKYLWHFGVTLVFTIDLYGSSGVKLWSNHKSQLSSSVGSVELALAVYFASKLCNEILQMLLTGKAFFEHFFWNVIDLVECVSFLAPFAWIRLKSDAPSLMATNWFASFLISPCAAHYVGMNRFMSARIIFAVKTDLPLPCAFILCYDSEPG